MKSETNDVEKLFKDRRQYCVPFYQRAYVWGKEEQWEPLWSDIRDKADARANGESPAPHFLGAIVLEPQQRTGLKGVEAYYIIDGQQRLTTLQYFLVALGIAIRNTPEPSILPLIEACIWNPNLDTMRQPETEIYKVWPTFRDREPYKIAMRATNREELHSHFPTSFTQSRSLKKIGVDHPAVLEAIWFFGEQIETWLDITETTIDDRASRLETLAEAVLRDLKFVVILLEPEDDAQVIFETLNGRGAELNATDLIRNFIFMRADREGADGADLYENLWTPFEGSFWTEPQRRGRLKRPRLEWFVQTTLQAELADAVEIGRLYTDYRRYGLAGRVPLSAENQLRTLTKHADSYWQLMTGAGTNPISKFGARMAAWDASPTHSLALRVSSLDLPQEEQTRIFDDIASYLFRRALCGLPAKNYNNVFIQLLKRFSGEGATADAFRRTLSAQKGDSSRWPGDDEFRHAWLHDSAHQRLGDVARVRAALTELENGLRSRRTEEQFVPSPGMLDVDHILPEKWVVHWPLNGQVVTAEEASRALASIFDLETPSTRIEAINERERLKNTFGNLTLVHYGINRSLQHGPFSEKRRKLFEESNLHLNRTLMLLESWDETAIQKRGSDLFDVARTIWRGPASLS